MDTVSDALRAAATASHACTRGDFRAIRELPIAELITRALWTAREAIA